MINYRDARRNENQAQLAAAFRYKLGGSLLFSSTISGLLKPDIVNKLRSLRTLEFVIDV